MHDTPQSQHTTSSMPRGAGSFTWSWGALLALGVINIITGIVALAWPGVTVLALALVLGIFLLLLGITVLAYSGPQRSGWTIALGVISIVGGIICLVHPGAGVFAILFGAAFYFVLTGMVDISLAVGGARDRWLWGVLGVLSIIAGIVMLVDGGVAIVTVALIAGISFLIRGMGQIGLAMRLRSSAGA